MDDTKADARGQVKPDEAEVREALKQVIDPELGMDIVDLGLVYDIDIHDDGSVVLTMTMTAPGCPLAATITEDAKWALRQVEGVKDVQVELVWDPPWTPDMMSEEARARLYGW